MQLPIQREIVPEMWRLSLTARSIRNPLKYIALLCAFGSALPLTKHPAPYG